MPHIKYVDLDDVENVVAVESGTSLMEGAIKAGIKGLKPNAAAAAPVRRATFISTLDF